MKLSVLDKKFDTIYTALVHKAERKGRTRAETDEISYSLEQIEAAPGSDISYGEFLDRSPGFNPRAELIKGKVCGIRVETIDDPLMKKVRQPDKLIDEPAKGKTPEVIKR